MFLDASAIVALLVDESDAAALARRLEQATEAFTSAIAIYEAVLGVARVRNVGVAAAQSALDEFLAQGSVRIVPVTAHIGRGAVAAFARYGRGRHPAALNMGDCFAHACARALDLPLLCKGGDFLQTDIALA
jgi:ribonuclease VapC